MNILIPDSWLREFLKTNATPRQFAKAMSLASVSIERMSEVNGDIVYDIEVTTNRPELMSVEGIAREATAVLPQQGYEATFLPHTTNISIKTVKEDPILRIENDNSLVNRILAVVLEVNLGPSPKIITERLEKTGIRSLNNVIDVTNYIMREVGHPSHVFDYDRLQDHSLIIRKSKKGEMLKTLDGKVHVLPGEDIVADNGKGEIVDLLGIMGASNSVVTDDTKRIVLFLDNNNPQLLRKTSMNLGIRSEAAIINEKGIDPELMLPTLLRGIDLLKKNASGKVISPIIDIYPNKPKVKQIVVPKEKISALIGVLLPDTTIIQILENLGFSVQQKENMFNVTVPTVRSNDIAIQEDIIEEIARTYGYHKIPNILPPLTEQNYYHQDTSEYNWIKRLKDAFCFWGFNEVYTYSMVSEEQFDGPIEDAIKLRNPLTEDRVYLRKTLTLSIIEVALNNKNRADLLLFEISNVYRKTQSLPDEVLTLAALIKGERATFEHAKGIVERVFQILGIRNYTFEKSDDALCGATIQLGKKTIGHIEVLDMVTFEIDLSAILSHASSQKTYKQPPKFPPVIEDIRAEISPQYTYFDVQKALLEVDVLISSVDLLDVYHNKKTFRITYLDPKGNLTNEAVTPIREKLLKVLTKKFGATLS